MVPPGIEGYLVQPGDTLWSIARRHGTSVDKLYALNSMTTPQDLRAGQRLQVPRASTQSDATPVPSLRTPQPEEPPATKIARVPSAPAPTSRYGRRGGRPHDGVDIGAAQGTAVQAAAAGQVIFAGVHGGYGKLVLVRHANGLVTVYAHQRDIAVRKGQRVTAGQLLGHVGTTGRASGPHLHFEVRRGARPENPLRHLPP